MSVEVLKRSTGISALLAQIEAAAAGAALSESTALAVAQLVTLGVFSGAYNTTAELLAASPSNGRYVALDSGDVYQRAGGWTRLRNIIPTPASSFTALSGRYGAAGESVDVLGRSGGLFLYYANWAAAQAALPWASYMTEAQAKACRWASDAANDANAVWVRMWDGDTARMEWSGADGRGLADDAAAVNATITAAGLIGGVEVRVRPDALHLMSVPLVTPSKPITLRGGRWQYGGPPTSTFRATSPMAALYHCQTGYLLVENIRFDANQQANYAVSLNTSFSEWRYCEFTNAKFDGVNLPQSAVNDGNIIWEPFMTSNGTMYCSNTTQFNDYAGRRRAMTPGSVSISINNDKVIGVGTAFLSIPARRGDFIRIGDTFDKTRLFQIYSIDSDTQITLAVRRKPIAALVGQSFTIGVGNGYREESHNDNNINKLYGGLFRGNAGSGIVFNGLFASRSFSAQADGNGAFAIEVGRADNGNPVYRTSILDLYSEGNAGTVFAGNMVGGRITFGTAGDAAGDLIVSHQGDSAHTSQWYGTVDDGMGPEPFGGAVTPVDDTVTYPQETAIDLDTLSGVPINPTGYNQFVRADAPVVMTATPNIRVGAEGEHIQIFNIGPASVTLKCEATLSGSGIRHATDIVIPADKSVELWYNSMPGGGWYRKNTA